MDCYTCKFLNTDNKPYCSKGCLIRLSFVYINSFYPLCIKYEVKE